MLDDPVIRKSVLAGVIATVIAIILINPLLNLLWICILRVGEYVYRDFAASIYRGAALGSRDWVIVSFFIVFTSVGVGFIVGIWTGFIKVHRRRKAKRPPKLWRPKFLVFLGALFSLLTILSLLVLCISAFADLQLNTSFQQRLTVLAPKISDQEYKEFKASWASMRSRQDYEKINQKLEEMAKSRGVELPKPLLK